MFSLQAFMSESAIQYVLVVAGPRATLLHHTTAASLACPPALVHTRLVPGRGATRLGRTRRHHGGKSILCEKLNIFIVFELQAAGVT